MKTINRSKLSRESLRRQIEENYNRRNEGAYFGSIFRDDIEVKQWVCKSSDTPHLIDIIPYIASANHPNKKVKEGDLVYTASYYVHKRVGANNAMFICLGLVYNEPCPICEERKRLADEYGFDDERVRALKPSLQSLYNVIVYDDKEEEKKGIQVWMVPHFFMEKKLLDISKKPRGGGFIYYADPDEGKTISFYRKGKENVEFTGHQFLDRDYVITDEEIQSTYCLEELVYKPTYEEVAEAFYGRGGRQKDREVVDRDRRERLDSRLIRQDADEGREEDEEYEDEETAKINDDRKTYECKYGGVFGVDIDMKDECGECDLYDKCAIEADRLEEEKNRKNREEIVKRPISKRRG